MVGTQLGMLSIFNRRSGWGDCVDRIPGFVFCFFFHGLNCVLSFRQTPRIS